MVEKRDRMFQARFWESAAVRVAWEILASGILALATPGFLLYIARQVRSHWWDEQARGLHSDVHGLADVFTPAIYFSPTVNASPCCSALVWFVLS